MKLNEITIFLSPRASTRAEEATQFRGSSQCHAEFRLPTGNTISNLCLGKLTENAEPMKSLLAHTGDEVAHDSPTSSVLPKVKTAKLSHPCLFCGSIGRTASLQPGQCPQLSRPKVLLYIERVLDCWLPFKWAIGSKSGFLLNATQLWTQDCD